MGCFVNPDNSGFQTALNAEIYVDKTEIIGYNQSCTGVYGCIYL